MRTGKLVIDGLGCLVSERKPCAKVIRSPVGGAWIIPLNEEGEDVLGRYFEETAHPIDPLNGELGYIVEPYEANDLGEYLIESGHTWTVE